MQLSVDDHETMRIVSVDSKRLDAANAVTFRDELLIQATDGKDTELVVDLGQVEFVDSSGLGALVSALKNIRQERPIALCGLQKPVANLMKLTRMDRMFTIYDNAEAAVAQTDG